MPMRVLLALAAAASCVGLGLRTPAAAGDAADLAPPFAVSVGGGPIDSAHDRQFDLRDDNSFPWVGEFDGGGRPDRRGGRADRGEAKGGDLRVYRNPDD